MSETYTHNIARMRAERKFNEQNIANGGIMKDCWNYLTPGMQKIFIDRELEQIMDEEDEAERKAEESQFGLGC